LNETGTIQPSFEPAKLSGPAAGSVSGLE